jgi:hypothetical protein
MPARRSPRLPSFLRLKTAFATVLTFLALSLLSVATWAQSAQSQNQGSTAPPSQAQQPNSPSTSEGPGAGASVQNPTQAPDNGNGQSSSQPQSSGNGQASGQDQTQSPANSNGQASQQPEPETHITKDQAKELFRSVDEILQFSSKDTGLPIEHQVKRNLITRQQVTKYVDKRMKDDKDTKRLEEAQLVLEKFGLLPRGYDLHSEFVKLMAEQVAAYYDPKTQSVNLLDWLPADAQKPVLAHELTHALQDQAVGLDKWELAGGKEDGSPLPDQPEYANEEAQAARQCITEGQAQVVWFNYSLAPIGKNILTAPQFVDAVRAAMGDNKDSPVFAQAPLFLKESLLLPYTFGLDFVRTVLANRGKDAAFAGLLHDPPVDTRQIMQPETYLMHQVVAPPTVPDLDALVGRDYKRIDFGSMGEFDVYLLAKQYGAEDTPNYYRHWRGGYYFATHAKSAPKDQIAMLYYSKWDSPEAARDFAKLYLDYLPKRYSDKVAWTSHCTISTSGSNIAKGCQMEQGSAGGSPILMEWHDNELLIMEGYDLQVIDRARNVFFYHMTPGEAPKGKN